MLVLPRRVGEVLRIGDVRLTVLSTTGGRVRLGVEAPASVPVWRAEMPPEAVAEMQARAEVAAERVQGVRP